MPVVPKPGSSPGDGDLLYHILPIVYNAVFCTLHFQKVDLVTSVLIIIFKKEKQERDLGHLLIFCLPI